MKSFNKLKTKLAELFQLDQADQDLGIYQIINAWREEITRFPECDLLPQVRETFELYPESTADGALYEAKKAGKNQTVFQPAPTAE